MNFAFIAMLPLDIGAHIPTVDPNVRLNVDYAKKIVIKHNLRYEAFFVIPDLISDSYIIKEKKNHLLFMGEDPRTNEQYNMVLKSAKSATETWLVTLHRTREEQVRSRLRRAKTLGTILREPERPFDE
ncbi:hypothetical protein GWK16_06825 [Roseomonas sp. JC162]|uniref:Uncharacterized protein n=1 Tax=Neoroseomonas marina TaxID=1232220 RepID=A0A848EA46_9PROT|nr:hypothetical protein [Neoroseomonas marina]NMJ40946.1 hypothetical protein [Neoroseomonas marina]